ncbi:MAG: AarF/ABC1/UbiB kinase family protein [Deltaproteobacteria bacterium]|nr:AarF/ABC1/UbiB kinase family protein [Deltaproteobacteria bacterium]
MSHSGKITQIPSSTVSRTRRFATMGIRSAGCYIQNLFARALSTGDEKDEISRQHRIKQARIFANELGKMKGAAMKVGQLMGLVGVHFGLSMDICEVMSSLNDSSVPLYWECIGNQLNTLSADLEVFDIQKEAVSAASLGQVHKAIHKETGKEYCFKIQYPSLKRTVDSDLKALSIALGVSNFFPEGLNPEPLLNEIRTLLLAELDYLREVRFMDIFRSEFQSETLKVPGVLKEYSSENVICMEFINGFPLDSIEVSSLSQKMRDSLGEKLIDITLREIFVLNAMQTDPNMGNFMVEITESSVPTLYLLDFGAVKVFPENFILAYREMIRGSWESNRDRMFYAIRELDFMPDTTPRSVKEQFCELVDIALEPFKPQRKYNWNTSDVPIRLSNLAARSALTPYFRLPPEEILFLHRKLAGVFAALSFLGVEMDTSHILEKYI